MIVLWDLFTHAKHPPTVKGAVISSRFAVLSSLVRGVTNPRFVILDDSCVHPHGKRTLDRIAETMNQAFPGSVDADHDLYPGVDFTGLGKEDLDQVCPRLAAQATNAIAEQVIPRVTKNVRSLPIKLPVRRCVELMESEQIRTVDVTNHALARSLSSCYTLLFSDDLRARVLTSVPGSEKIVKAVSLRLFIRLDDSGATVRLAPFVLPEVRHQDLEVFLSELGVEYGDIPLGPVGSEPGEATDIDVNKSLAAETHQLICHILSRSFFSAIKEEFLRESLPDVKVEIDEAFADLVLGQELRQRVVERGHRAVVAMLEAMVPGVGLPGESPFERLEPLADVDEGSKRFYIGDDVAGSVVEHIRTNWRGDKDQSAPGQSPHIMTRLSELQQALREKYSDRGAWNADQVTCILHALCDGGFVSAGTVKREDSTMDAPIYSVGWRVGESSKPVPGSISGSKYTPHGLTSLPGGRGVHEPT